PLIDLEELSKIWFNENASGQFKGQLAVVDFDPKEKNSWLKNLHVNFRSEENVHDIQYGILYGKHFALEVDTKDGDGTLNLHTRKGKIKNLQITNLSSQATIEDRERLVIESTSLKAADGVINLNGNINLKNWDSFFTGSMDGVNIETVSNNLFNNLGDYNGKGRLEYNFKGNFKELLTSKPPEDAYGRFAIQQGSLVQVQELSKNLHLVNLIFGGPFNLGGFFSSLEKFRNPQGEGNFKLIDGEWSFDGDQKKIRLEEANYVGTNALHLKLFGDWDYKNSIVDLDVFGFMPKKPKYIGQSEEDIEKFKELENERTLRELLQSSRHFKFEVKGNAKEPSQLKNSVKGSIKFLDTSMQSEVSKTFLEGAK
ncbi:MAG: hypothetical protein SFU25_04045, partial [Candidatus Caenarcaniphilales bacterium]|nr:hypothetical protein [Candidatus Caenarcaniphilales bacterium]